MRLQHRSRLGQSFLTREHSYLPEKQAIEFSRLDLCYLLFSQVSFLTPGNHSSSITFDTNIIYLHEQNNDGKT
jgi:hypothetical protein